MRWIERVFNTYSLHVTKDAITMEPMTVAFTAALDPEHGDRVALETVHGKYKSIEEFDRACDEESQREEGLYYLIVLPLREAYSFSEALASFLTQIPEESPFKPEAEVLA